MTGRASGTAVLEPPPAQKPSRTTTKSQVAAKKDDRRLQKTNFPGVYRRGPRSYTYIYYVDGKQRKGSARTKEAARRARAAKETDADRGDLQVQSNITLHAYVKDWIERYHGNGKRGFREHSRKEYRRLLDSYALKYFRKSLKLTDLTPLHLAKFVGWLADDEKQGKHLSDKSIANTVIPVRAMLATAVREGLLRTNPAFQLALPHRDDNEVDEEDEDDEIRTFSRKQLKQVLEVVDVTHLILFTLLACTGLRISEGIGLRWKDLFLDVPKPYLRIRRAIVKGDVVPPKTKYGRRKVPLSKSMVLMLRFARACVPGVQDEDYVFLSEKGTALDPDNLRHRVLKPAVKAVGAEWAGFHTFRHTFASLQIAKGINLLQLSRALGHHSPAFTLKVYGHLLEDEHAPALSLEQELAPGRVDELAARRAAVAAEASEEHGFAIAA